MDEGDQDRRPPALHGLGQPGGFGQISLDHSLVEQQLNASNSGSRLRSDGEWPTSKRGTASREGGSDDGPFCGRRIESERERAAPRRGCVPPAPGEFS
jgi:hypothetical protein